MASRLRARVARAVRGRVTTPPRPPLYFLHIMKTGGTALTTALAQINNSPEWGGPMMSQYFDHVVHVFIDALREAFPDCEPRELYWAYHFLSGALTLTFAETRRVDNLSGGLCKSTDLDAVHARLVPFCTAGFKALCSGKAAPARRRTRKK